MTFRVSGKNLDVGDALRERVSARIGEAMGKYFDGGYSGHATLEREGFGFRTECAIHLDSKITLHAEGMAADAYASADQAATRIEKRLRRYHRRLKDHRPERLDGRETFDAASSCSTCFLLLTLSAGRIAFDATRSSRGMKGT